MSLDTHTPTFLGGFVDPAEAVFEGVAPRRPYSPAPAPDTPAPRIIALADAAEIVPLSAKTLYRVAQSGEGPFLKIAGRWMVYEDELHAWVRSHGKQDEATPRRRRAPSRRRGTGGLRGRILMEAE